MYALLDRAYSSLRGMTDFEPDFGIVLGSGLSSVADRMDVRYRIPYAEIDGMPVSTVQGHTGVLLLGTFGGTKVAVMQGRVHYYETGNAALSVLPVRLLIRMGAKAVILTNAAGGVDPSYDTGDIMLIRDHISLAPNPLDGAHDDRYGPRFPDMTDAYDPQLRKTAESAARDLGIALKEGVYIQLTGPSFETAAEVAMARALGADAVGMSTAIEAVAARHMGAKVLGFSFISNKACGLNDEPLSHLDVQKESARVADKLAALIEETVRRAEV